MPRSGVGSGVVDAVKRGLGGPNSFAVSINEFGVADGQAESSEKDPYNENFCAYGTGLTCLPFVWRYGSLRQLPTLGGNNASLGNINNRGEVAGYAEKGTRDPGCLPRVAPNGTGPQVLGYEGVVWGPRRGEIRKLRPLLGDTVSAALWVNDDGEAVGMSGDMRQHNHSADCSRATRGALGDETDRRTTLGHLEAR